MLYVGLFTTGLLFTLAGVLPIVNPLAMAPTFVALTETIRHQGMRTALALRIGRNVALMLTGTMLLGSFVLNVFGISLAIVRVGGGMIVAATAWRLLNSTPSTTDRRQEIAETFTPEQVRDRAFYPMTFPLSCGPGSVAASIAVGAWMHEAHWGMQLAKFSGGVVANMMIGAAVYFTYRYAQTIFNPLGRTGIVVFSRLSAFILLCVGVQIIWNGGSELVQELALNIARMQSSAPQQ